MKRLLPCLLAFGALACGGDELPNCDNYKRGDWAIQLDIDPADDGSCPYEGTFALEGEATEDLICGSDEGSCSCVGGREFGVYEVTLTNTDTGTTEAAVLEIEELPSPECVGLTAIEQFAPTSGMGGMGGGS